MHFIIEPPPVQIINLIGIIDLSDPMLYRGNILRGNIFESNIRGALWEVEEAKAYGHAELRATIAKGLRLAADHYLRLAARYGDPDFTERANVCEGKIWELISNEETSVCCVPIPVDKKTNPHDIYRRLILHK